MNIGSELVVSLLTTAVGIGISYATLKVKIDNLEKTHDQMQKSMSIIRDDHGTRIARIEEAMVSIKNSIASIDAKLDRLMLK
jgi:wobble nucleotide-excising tRNase